MDPNETSHTAVSEYRGLTCSVTSWLVPHHAAPVLKYENHVTTHCVCTVWKIDIKNLTRHVDQQQVNDHSYMKNHKLLSIVNLSFNNVESESSAV